MALWGHRGAIKGLCCVAALLVVLLLSLITELPEKAITRPQRSSVSRRLLSSPFKITHAWRVLSEDDTTNDDGVGANCTDIQSQDDPCQYVKDNCDGVPVLIDYLSFRYCTLNGNQGEAAAAYVVLFLWLAVIISLLATTADNHFVPCLQTLSESLKLSKPVAGITLLALGNGAPDVFTAIAGLQADDFPLVLGALIGASMCISSFILGSVLLVADVKVQKKVFLRDILVYITATVTIVAVAFDGVISLYEAFFFLIIYVVYIGLVVGLDRWEQNKLAKSGEYPSADPSIQATDGAAVVSTQGLLAGSDYMTSAMLPASDGEVNEVEVDQEDEEDQDPLYLCGLSFPKKEPAHKKIQYFLELPFSVLRWLSSPPADKLWSKPRRWFFIVAPVFVGFLLLLTAEGWDGFTLQVNDFPVSAIVGITGVGLSILLFLTTNTEEIPVYYALFTFVSFCTSIAWLNILANECVALLATFGIMWNISTAVLGLTVLAIGNSVGDFVADTAVARLGSPETGVASCFGSPLLNDVVGLGISLTVTTAGIYPDKFYFDLNTQVVIGWAFLGWSLAGSLVVFVAYKYAPPRWYGMYLVILYIAFLIATVTYAVI